MSSIPGRLKTLIRDIVVAQDEGYPVAEELAKQGWELTFIDRIVVAADTERLRMRAEGVPVYARTNDSDALILGLKDRPFKKYHECIQHDWKFSQQDATKRYCSLCHTVSDVPATDPPSDGFGQPPEAMAPK